MYRIAQKGTRVWEVPELHKASILPIRSSYSEVRYIRALTIILYFILTEHVHGSIAIGNTRKERLTITTEIMLLIIYIYPKYDDTEVQLIFSFGEDVKIGSPFDHIK
jgi:hypothetical protein